MLKMRMVNSWQNGWHRLHRWQQGPNNLWKSPPETIQINWQMLLCRTNFPILSLCVSFALFLSYPFQSTSLCASFFNLTAVFHRCFHFSLFFHFCLMWLFAFWTKYRGNEWKCCDISNKFVNVRQKRWPRRNVRRQNLREQHQNNFHTNDGSKYWWGADIDVGGAEEQSPFWGHLPLLNQVSKS